MSNDTALIVIDMQDDILGQKQRLYEEDKLIANVNYLIASARMKNIPIFFILHIESQRNMVNVYKLVNRKQNDLVIMKSTPDAFYKTSLQSELIKLSVHKLVIAGVRTEYCIDTTCRRAYSLGYKVTMVTDAHSTIDNGNLTAKQIIDHHNEILGDWFVIKEKTIDVKF